MKKLEGMLSEKMCFWKGTFLSLVYYRQNRMVVSSVAFPWIEKRLPVHK